MGKRGRVNWPDYGVTLGEEAVEEGDGAGNEGSWRGRLLVVNTELGGG